MTHSQSRRGKIRQIAYIIAALTVASALAVTGWAAARRWRTLLENTHQRAWAELTGYLADIEATLNKLLYTNSLPEQTALSAQLLRDTGCAKGALTQLPLTDAPADGIFRFLSQAGEYAHALTVQYAAGGGTDNNTTDHLRALYHYVDELNTGLGDYRAGNDAFSFTGDALPTITDGFREVVDGLEAYPTLIYDGPFADHIGHQTPQMTTGFSDFGEAVARSSAEAFLKLGHFSDADLSVGPAIGGNFPCYTFYGDQISLDISRYGALPVRFLCTRTVTESRIAPEQALTNAEVFLAAEGYTDFHPCYYAISDHILTINYAAISQGIRCYPDQLKVSIALDDGTVVAFDASPYLMNHKERTWDPPTFSASDGAGRLNPLLVLPEEYEAPLVIIPTEGGREVLCYEYQCTGVHGETVLVYLDAQTGQERRILILTRWDGGTFVM